jgi:hypothetical protein
MAQEYPDNIIESILTGLAEGKSLAQICRGEGMPDRVTVWRWGRADDELAARMLEARECGFLLRAEVAVANAKACTDPIKGRLEFDAERWFLGKLSNAFADKPLALGVQVNVGSEDAFAAVTDALERAAATIAGGGTSTRPVAIEGPSRSGDAPG